jgi:hypothetical protein
MYVGGQGSALPSLVIGEMRAPTIASTGVTVQEMENYVLSLPGVTPGLANAIRSIGDPTKTLPIPIPAGAAQSHAVTIQGVQGVAVGDSTGLGSGVVWEKDGIIYGVAGTQTEDAILATANSLH